MSADDVAGAKVLAANRAFYLAFAKRDWRAMDDLWARQAAVACIHPGWRPLRGREDVMASWRAIFESGGAPPIVCSEATAHVMGDCAFVICHEDLPGGRLVATNVFVREGDDWRMAHHQAAAVALPDDDLSVQDEPGARPN
jgi:ketosteroid isomerase-like protein